MSQIIIHVDMDAFYASVEIRDNPSLAGKPVIIGSRPQERGVVATASYEARKYGVHSAMNIKEAYLLCPMGIFIRPNFDKYKAVSAQLHEIWNEYATASEYISLDEAYLDVTESAGSFEKAREFARRIKERTEKEIGLTCSVGLAYSKTAAKTASEEKKPNGYFEILNKEDFVGLMQGRPVGTLYTVGEKTAEKLNRIGIFTVRDIQSRREDVIRLLGKQGIMIANIASGIDDRKVVPYRPEDAKSISREVTFQEDVDSFPLLKDVILLLSFCVENRAKRVGLYGQGVTLKVTYADMKGITRSRAVPPTNDAILIYRTASDLLDQVPVRPIRLIGAGIHNLDTDQYRQMTLSDFLTEGKSKTETDRDRELARLQDRYHLDFAGHLEQIYRHETLYKTIEYMRKHVPKG